MNKYSSPLSNTGPMRSGKKTMVDYLRTVEHAQVQSVKSPVSYIAGDKPKLIMGNFDASNFRTD